MTDTGYNGWSNAATWAASLWMGNDWATYKVADRMAARATSTEELADAYRRRFPNAATSAASWTRDEDVNWHEVAEAWREDHATA